MDKLFVEKSMEIHAPPEKVWSALTRRENTRKWAAEFGPEFRIESDWNLGSAVTWKNENGEVMVEGSVTEREPRRLLRFTAFDVRQPRPLASTEDGITYEIIPHNGSTILEVRQGDFSAMPDGEKYQHMSEEIWERVLPKVKELAEH